MGEVSALSSMARAANGVVGWLLRSSFSGLLERSLLLDVRGRRTGHHYRLPVQYAQAGPVIWVLPAGARAQDVVAQPAPGAAGRAVAGRTAAQRPGVGGQRGNRPDTGLEGLRVYLRRFPSTARRSGTTGPDGTTDQDRLREFAARIVIVRILPDGDGGRAAG